MNARSHLLVGALLLGVVRIAGARTAAPPPAPAPPPLPQGDAGISARYIEDRGIDRDPAVILVDGFESAVPGKPGKAWENAWGGPDRLRVATGEGEVNSGERALEMVLTRPSAENAIGCGMQKTLSPEHDVLFLRYYARFGKDSEFFHGGAHNGGTLEALAPGMPMASPGIRADGRNKFIVLLDSWRPNERIASPGDLVVYVYHPEQGHQWGEQFFPSGDCMPQGKKGRAKFGPHFNPRPNFVPELGRWYCYELMVKANAPGVRDGRIAYWVDGELVADFPGLRLRDVEELKLNRVNLGIYTHNELVQKPIVMSFDDVVLSSSYIGPMLTREKAKAAAAKKKPKRVVRPAPKPRAKNIAAAALAPWEAKLVARVRARVEEGTKLSIRLKLPGMGSRLSTVVAADERSLSIVAGGMNAALPWRGLSALERMSLAGAVVREDSSDDQILAGVFALAAGEAGAATEYFDRARALDPEGGAERVAAAKESLGL